MKTFVTKLVNRDIEKDIAITCDIRDRVLKGEDRPTKEFEDWSCADKIMVASYGKGYMTGRKHGLVIGIVSTLLGAGVATTRSILSNEENREAIKEFTKDKVNEIKRKFKKNKDEVVEVETTDIEEE